MGNNSELQVKTKKNYIKIILLIVFFIILFLIFAFIIYYSKNKYNDKDIIIYNDENITSHSIKDSLSIKAKETNIVTPITVGVNVTGKELIDGSLNIQKINNGNNYQIPGYMGHMFDISCVGKIASVSLCFKYDENYFGDISESFIPKIYYYDEKNNFYEELANQEIKKGNISASTNHLSKYLLLNSVEFDKMFKNEVLLPKNNKNGLNIIFCIDTSNSMKQNDPELLRVKAVRKFIDNFKNANFNSLISIMEFYESNKMLCKFRIPDADVEYGECMLALDKIRNDKNGTNINYALTKAYDLIKKPDIEDIKDRENVNVNINSMQSIIILLTDGKNSYSNDQKISNALIDKINENKNVEIYTISIGDDVCVSYLQELASITNGKFFQLAESEKVLNVYENLSENIKNNNIDSNNDGISDYYTEMIAGRIYDENGKVVVLPCSELILGRDLSKNDDYDRDGLKNGEEIEICEQIVNGNKTAYLKINTDPTNPDTDFDGYDDYNEIKKMKTNPKLYTWDKEMIDTIFFINKNIAKIMQHTSSMADLVLNNDDNKIDIAKDVLIKYFTLGDDKYSYDEFIDEYNIFNKCINNFFEPTNDILSISSDANTFVEQTGKELIKYLRIDCDLDLSDEFISEISEYTDNILRANDIVNIYIKNLWIKKNKEKINSYIDLLDDLRKNATYAPCKYAAEEIYNLTMNNKNELLSAVKENINSNLAFDIADIISDINSKNIYYVVSEKFANLLNEVLDAKFDNIKKTNAISYFNTCVDILSSYGKKFKNNCVVEELYYTDKDGKTQENKNIIKNGLEVLEIYSKNMFVGNLLDKDQEEIFNECYDSIIKTAKVLGYDIRS